MNLIVGKEIEAKTNADFYNLLFGTNYKQYMRSIYNLSNESVVWMIRIDSTELFGFKKLRYSSVNSFYRPI